MRNPPSNIQAEQALLGAILANNKAFERVAEFLDPEHFADLVNGRIYAECAKLIESGRTADAVTLRTVLDGTGALEDAGGTAYLAQLLSAMVGITNAGDYGRAVKDTWTRRRVIEAAEAMIEDAHTEGGDGLIERAEGLLWEIGSERPTQGLQHVNNAFDEAIAITDAAMRSGRPTGLQTGFREWDKMTGGMQPGDLIVIAGRPGMGKTALAWNLATNVAEAGGKVAFFSLEMGAVQLAMRELGARTGISGERMRRGDIGMADFDKLHQAARMAGEMGIDIDDTPAISVAAMRTRARRKQRKGGLDLILVDYLQLMSAGKGNRIEILTNITMGLKATAKELGVPMVALSQLSRAVEARDDKRPQLSDLRESGTIEQDADSVAFVYREEYYLSKQEPKPTQFKSDDQYASARDRWNHASDAARGQAELILAKNRHGPSGTVAMTFDGPRQTFGER
jgi:replicative DNA helicase